MRELELAAEELNSRGFVARVDNRAWGPTLLIAKRLVRRDELDCYEPDVILIHQAEEGGWVVQPPIFPSSPMSIGDLAAAIACALELLEICDEASNGRDRVKRMLACVRAKAASPL